MTIAINNPLYLENKCFFRSLDLLANFYKSIIYKNARISKKTRALRPRI